MWVGVRWLSVLAPQDFLLQKRKRLYRLPGTLLYRIVTREKKNGSTYEIVKGDDLRAIYDLQWRYIVRELPSLVPETSAGEGRVSWLIAHFTQLALGTNAGTGAVQQALQEAEIKEEEVEEEVPESAAVADEVRVAGMQLFWR